MSKLASLPKYDDLYQPTLKALDELGGSASIEELEDALIAALNLTQEQLDVTYPKSGAAGLHDGRVLALECKVSNSAVNSYKRLVREAGGKATDWLRTLGDAQVVPGAVIGGVFNADNVLAAQSKGLAIFWSHRLEDLTDFIKVAI